MSVVTMSRRQDRGRQPGRWRFLLAADSFSPMFGTGFSLPPFLHSVQLALGKGKRVLDWFFPLLLGTTAMSACAANLAWTTNNGAICDGPGTWNQGNPSITAGNGAWFDGINFGVRMQAGDQLTFGGGVSGASGTITNGTALAPGGIVLLTPKGGGSYTIGTNAANVTGNAITLNGGLITNSGSSGALFNCPVNGTFAYGSTAASVKFAGTGSQTAADSVTLTTGTLQIGNNGAGGGFGAATITNNGSLVWKRSGTVNLFHAIYGTGSLKLWGNGATFLVWSNMNYSGITTFQPSSATASDCMVKLCGDNMLPTNTMLLIFQNSATPAGAQTLDLNGYNQAVGSLLGDQYASAATEIITNSSGTPSILTLDGIGMSSSFAGLIGGNLSLLLDGSGSTLVLSNVANTYTGDTIINSGTLALKAGASLASANIKLTTTAAVLDVSGVTGGYSLGPGQTLSGMGVVTGMVSTAADSVLAPGNPGFIGTLNFSNNLALAGNLVVDIDRSQAQSSDLIHVAGQITNSGTGTITVSNLGPAVRLGDKFTLFNSPVANGGALTIVSASGVAFINNLALDGSISVPPPASLSWTTNGGGIYDGPGTWNQGTPSITAGNGAWTDGTNYNLTMNSGDYVTFGGGMVGSAGTISLGNGITPGRITFVNANGGGSYTIGTSVSDPPLTMLGGVITNSSSSGAFFNCAINGSFTIGSSGGTIKLANDSSQTAADSVTITKGIVQIGNNGSTGGLGAAVITNNSSLVWKRSGYVSVLNTIYGTGTLKLWGNGATFLLWSNMCYSGSTTFQPSSSSGPDCLVQLCGNNVLPINTALQILQNSATPAGAQILDLNGNNQVIGSLSGDQYASATTEIITNSSSTQSVLTLGGAGMSSSFAGLIGGNLSLVLSGSGSTLTLSNVANNYTGNTVINAGTLKVTGIGGLVSTPNIVINSGTLQMNGSSCLAGGIYAGNITNNGAMIFNSATDQILTGMVSGTGAVTQNGPGLLRFDGTGRYSGSTTVNGGTMQVNGVFGTTAITVTNGGALCGNGVLLGATSIKRGGTLVPGLGGADNSMLTISNNLSLAGNVFFSLNRNYFPVSARVAGVSNLIYGGTLNVTNLGGALQPGDSFQLFTARSYAGNFTNFLLPPLLSGLSWNTNGLTNGYISVTGVTALPTVGIAASNISKNFGQTISFSGTEFFTGNLPNGVTVTNVALTSAGATNSAPVGIYAIMPGNAQGAGLTNCNVIYTNGALTVIPAVPVLSVSSGGSPTVYGDSVAVTARITPAQAAGMVQFLINGVPFDSEPLSGGVAISMLNNSLPVGTNQLTAIFIPGDGNVLGATNSLQQVVITAPAQTNGLTAQYFNDPGFTSLNTALLDTNGINYNWSNSIPPGTTLTNGRPFAVRWSGQITPQYSETYSFFVTANSGVRLWVNDHLLLNSLSSVPPSVEMCGQISVTAGMRYNIQLEYLSNGSNSSVQLQWNSPSTPKQVLPVANCVPVTDPHERGSILTEIWQNLPGTSLAILTNSPAYPNQPAMRDTHFLFECIATNWGPNYGEKVSGYIEPLISGYYTFSVAASDTAELWLSTNDSTANRALLLAVTNATGFRQFTNISAPIRLAAWQKYYVELLHKAGSAGGDHYSVAWLAPGQSAFSVIGGDNLVPNYLDQTNIQTIADSWTNQMSQGHPRLQISMQRFSWLKNTIASASNQDVNSWWQTISNSAVALLTSPVVSTNDVYNGSREIDSRMKILGIAYRITGNTNFAECAWSNLQQVASANYPSDWFAADFLETADITRGMAIGYDWFYDYWTPARRNTIVTAIQSRGLNQGYAIYKLNGKSAGWWTKADANNWNLVCNSGMAAGVLALGMDAGIGSLNVQTNQYILSNAVVSVSSVMNRYATDNGAWYEGPGYWGYATRNLIPMLASLDTAIGTDFGLSATPALGETGNFAMGIMGNVQSSNLNFGYGDCGFGITGGMPMFWLARRYNRPEYAAYERDFGHLADKNDGLSCLDIVWYDWRGTDQASSNIPPDNYYRGLSGTTAYNPANVITLRGAWEDPDATAVLFKTGTNWDSAHEQLDSGSFMLDSGGIRWAQDFGSDDYSLPGYFDNSTHGQRWTYYRLRAEGHNTLVINPGTNADQTVGAAPPILLYASHPDGDDSYAVADLTSACGIAKVWRGVKLFNSRRWFLVQDELQATNPATVWWFMHILTSMNPVISSNGQSVVLTQGTSQLWLTNLTGVGSFVISNAVPLPTSPNPVGQATNAGYEKLTIHLTGVTNTTLAILMVPQIVGQSPPANLPVVVPLSNWPTMDVSQPPVLSAVSNSTLIAGATLLVTNQVVDPNVPPQPLSFSLPVGPAGALINPASGIISWRPTISQAGFAYPFTVMVAETGGNLLSATQNFQVTVTAPERPTLSLPDVADGQFQLLVNGDFGPDYTVTVSTNLVSWVPVFTTNSPSLPFIWSEPVTNSMAQRFYRILLGP